MSITSAFPREVALFEIALADFYAIYVQRFPETAMIFGRTMQSINVTLSAPGLTATFDLRLPIEFTPQESVDPPAPGADVPADRPADA